MKVPVGKVPSSVSQWVDCEAPTVLFQLSSLLNKQQVETAWNRSKLILHPLLLPQSISQCFSLSHHWRVGIPTDPFTFLEHRNPSIGEFHVVPKRRATDFKTLKLLGVGQVGGNWWVDLAAKNSRQLELFWRHTSTTYSYAWREGKKLLILQVGTRRAKTTIFTANTKRRRKIFAR